MEGKKLAKFLLLMMALDLLLFSSTEGSPWWRRRSRRRRHCPSNRPYWATRVNNWNQSFQKTCPSSYSVRLWASHHRNCKKDRVHLFRCGYGPMTYRERDCSWSYYVNDYYKPLTFKCHHNGFIAGIGSEFHSTDRRFSFRCCHRSSYILHHCKITPYQNSYDRNVWYTVPSGYYLVGVYSYYSNHHQDRLWRFEICTRGRRGKRQTV